jgi:hypothetical protein
VLTGTDATHASWQPSAAGPTFPDKKVIVGDGSTTPVGIAPTATNNILQTPDGVNWASQAPVIPAASITGVLPTANGGTGNSGGTVNASTQLTGIVPTDKGGTGINGVQTGRILVGGGPGAPMIDLAGSVDGQVLAWSSGQWHADTAPSGTILAGSPTSYAANANHSDSTAAVDGPGSPVPSVVQTMSTEVGGTTAAWRPGVNPSGSVPGSAANADAAEVAAQGIQSYALNPVLPLAFDYAISPPPYNGVMTRIYLPRQVVTSAPFYIDYIVVNQNVNPGNGAGSQIFVSARSLHDPVTPPQWQITKVMTDSSTPDTYWVGVAYLQNATYERGDYYIDVLVANPINFPLPTAIKNKRKKVETADGRSALEKLLMPAPPTPPNKKRFCDCPEGEKCRAVGEK